MPLLLASSPVAPPPPVSVDWGPLGMTWTGADGRVWDLTDWRSGVCLTREGVTGLHNPRIKKFTSTSRTIPGHRLRGHRVEGRDVAWNVFVYGDGSEAWRRVYAAFFGGIRPDKSGTWTVTTGASKRSLKLTGVFDDDFEFPVDPLLKRWTVIPVSLEPEQPLWCGALVQSAPFKGPAPRQFITEDLAPTFHISDAATTARARLSNPGEVPFWLRWTAVGPVDDLVIGVAGVSAAVPFTVPEGSVLHIDTDPRSSSAVLDGVDVTPLLGLVDFAACPPGESVPLHVSFTGAGTVQASGQALHYRAF